MLQGKHWLVGLVLALVATLGAARDESGREALRLEIENLAQAGALSSGVEIAAGNILAEFYERRAFEPVWNSDRAAQLLVAIEGSYDDGLDPSDYYIDAVRAARDALDTPRRLDPVDRALADILLTESLVRLGYHERFGKVNPYSLDANWNFRRDLAGSDPVESLGNTLAAPSLGPALAELFPRGDWYLAIREKLKEYRAIQSAGGWPQVPAGPVLKRGDSDARVAVLARRLAVTGDLEVSPSVAPTSYDETLASGVKRFQVRHALDADGIVGLATLRAMNVPVEQRIQQLRLSLERSRWLTDDLEGDFVLVNIAGFYAAVLRDGDVVWTSRVQVGRAYRRTPVFRDQMRYLVFNPTWTAPFSLATRDVLPRVQKDPNYIDEMGFDVMDRNGDLIDPASVDWSTVTRSNFRYTFVQRPGPLNAMGRVKFMFPNQYSVYLHDTPSRALFERAERAFSAGCIRVERPLELAEELLGADGWDRDRIQDVLDGGEISTVFLSKPIPVFLSYWTADIGEDGRVHFFSDVYERDQKVAAELEEPFRLDPPDG